MALARLLAALLLVAVLAPVAAQVPEGTPLDPIQQPLRLAPGPDIADVRPLTGIGATNLSVQVHCSALDAQAPTTVDLAVESAPAWLTVTVIPTPVEFAANAPPPCVNEWRVQDASVVVSATANAPSGQPGEIVVVATMEDKTARAHLNATAAVFSAIDVTADSTIGEATPAEPWRFQVLVNNRGNARVDVAFETHAPEGVTVEVAGGPVGSRQMGDASSEAAFDVVVTPEATTTNGDYPIWVNATATVPGSSVRPVTGSVQLTTQVRGATEPVAENESPLAALAAAAALALSVALRRRRA